MAGKRCNPFIHAPLKLWGMCLMSLSAIVFVSQIVYGMILGLLWTRNGEMPEDRYLRFHEIMQRLLATDLRLHPWLSCHIHNPHGETFERGAIAICNHQSMVDTLCMLILSPRLLMVTNERVGRNPILRRVFKHAGFTTVGSSVEELMAYCKRQTLRGYTVIIFPEGERSADCNIKRFHNGAFHIARELELDILPLYLHGTGHVLPLHRAFQNKGSFYVEIGKRIPPRRDKETDPREQAIRMRHHYQERYEEICRRLETAHYFSGIVGDLFSRLWLGRHARRLLRSHDDFSHWIDRSLPENHSLLIEDHTKGVFTLLFALVHPFTPISVTGARELRRLYGRYEHLPANINFIDGANLLASEEHRPLYTIKGLANVSIAI